MLNLNEEIENYEQRIQQNEEDFILKSEDAITTIQRQNGVIARNEKLIVDMQQKDEMCKIVLATTDQKIIEKNEKTSTLEQRLKEMDDFRSKINGNIEKRVSQVEVFQRY